MEKSTSGQCSVMKWLKRFIIFWVILCLLFGAFVLGGLWSAMDGNPYEYEHEKALNALQKTGITSDFVPSFVFYGGHVGRDSYSQTFLDVWNDKEELMEIISNTEGWHVESLSSGDYRDFLEVTWYPLMVKQMIADDVEFDAWYYRETTPPAGYDPMFKGFFSFLGRSARGFVFAVFDEDTGLFIFIDQFG